MSTKIEVRLGRTISVGNFESLRVDVGIQKDVPDKTDLDKATVQLSKDVEKILDKEADRLLSNIYRSQK